MSSDFFVELNARVRRGDSRERSSARTRFAHASDGLSRAISNERNCLRRQSRQDEFAHVIVLFDDLRAAETHNFNEEVILLNVLSRRVRALIEHSRIAEFGRREQIKNFRRRAVDDVSLQRVEDVEFVQAKNFRNRVVDDVIARRLHLNNQLHDELRRRYQRVDAEKFHEVEPLPIIRAERNDGRAD